MYALGIETSCDETSCAVVRGRKVLSNATVSSLKYHKKYGGIVPEIAHRNHLVSIDKVFAASLETAGISPRDIGVIGVTYSPGLMGALIVGVNFAKGLSAAIKKPFLGINHLHAHMFAGFLNNKADMKFPFLGLVISGGHTEIFVVNDFDNIKKVGGTLDDACGEAFDKVGRAFGLGFPAGPVMDKMFDPRVKDSFKFKCGRIKWDLSFSGIKTALIYKKAELEKAGTFGEKEKVALVSSFQETVFKTIISNIKQAADKYNIKKVVCGGGVVSNSRFRELIGADKDIKVLFPPKDLSVDNGAMAAGLARYLYVKKGMVSDMSLEPVAS